MNEQSNITALDADSEPVAFNAALAEPFNVLIVGVGGQGVIMVSKVLASLAQAHGFEVKQSEVHGMAKRGGSVFSHVRFGRQVWSPTIPRGEAERMIVRGFTEVVVEGLPTEALRMRADALLDQKSGGSHD